MSDFERRTALTTLGRSVELCTRHDGNLRHITVVQFRNQLPTRCKPMAVLAEFQQLATLHANVVFVPMGPT